ncbi:hypothetical protein, partial [Microbacterium sp. K24]|uniref:hypothetical protein n=1 Tax=Microbacterium sp. K24 TaxID=2305446 RepID=UPI0014438FAA
EQAEQQGWNIAERVSGWAGRKVGEVTTRRGNRADPELTGGEGTDHLQGGHDLSGIAPASDAPKN